MQPSPPRTLAMLGCSGVCGEAKKSAKRKRGCLSRVEARRREEACRACSVCVRARGSFLFLALSETGVARCVSVVAKQHKYIHTHTHTPSFSRAKECAFLPQAGGGERGRGERRGRPPVPSLTLRTSPPSFLSPTLMGGPRPTHLRPTHLRPTHLHTRQGTALTPLEPVRARVQPIQEKSTTPPHP